jgi:tetratricopeptide (TPR) repeat protein
MKSSTAWRLRPRPIEIVPPWDLGFGFWALGFTLTRMHRAFVLGVTVAALVGATVLTSMDVRQQREFRRLLALGDAALARDQTFAAIEAFSGAMALRKTSMLPYLKRGDTYRHRGDYQAALRDLREAAALDPTAPRPLELLGDVNEALGRHARAIDDYGRYIALDDRAPRVLYKLAVAQFRSDDPAAAADALRRALAIDDRLPQAHYLLAMCLRAAHRNDAAVRALMRAVALDPSFVAARQELAASYAQLGRRRDEMEQLEALAGLEPARPERVVDVAIAHARNGRVDTAIVTLGRAAERYPQDAVIYAALGRVWLDAGETRDDSMAMSRAREALHRAAQAADAPSGALALYGRALLASGDVRGAERVLQQASMRTPIDPVALEYLAIAARRLGHVDIATQASLQHAALAP